MAASLAYERGRSPKQRIGNTVLLIIAIALGVTFMFPFFWTVTSSLKTPVEVSTYPPVWIPSSFRYQNYVEVFTRTFVSRWVLNSAYVSVLTVMGTILTSSLAAFSFARFDYRGRNLLFLLTLATMMLPAQVTLISRYMLFYRLGWINTFKPLWVPAWFGGGAYAIFLMRQFMLTLPRQLDEAALIDGAGSWWVFLRIILPLCKPVIATLSVIGFVAAWNNYMDPLIYLHDRKKMVLAVGIDTMNQDPTMSSSVGEPTYHLMMALCTIAIIPLVVLFFAAQRYFVQGIVMTGIKG